MRREYRGMLLMLVCAVLWSTSGFFIKLVPWGSLCILGVRGLFSTLVIFAYMRVKRMKMRFTKKNIVIGAAVALTAVLYIAAVKYTTAANAIVLQYTSPVWLLLLSVLVFKRKYRPGDYIVVAVTVLGIALFFFDELGAGGALGNFFAIFDGLTLGAVYLFSGESSEDERMTGIFVGNAASALVGLPFLLIDKPELTLITVGAVAVMGLFQVGLPYVIYSMALRTCPSLACALIASIEIVLNPVWVWLIVGETPGVYAIIGSAVIIGAITAWSCIKTRQEKRAISEL